MSINNPRRLPPQAGLWQELTSRGKLVLRLIGDRRVSFFYKLIPFTSLAYFLFPDIMPGPIDDAVLVWLTSYLFVELCPGEVVREHINDLSGNPIVQPRPAAAPPPPPPEDIIEGESYEVEDKLIE